MNANQEASFSAIDIYKRQIEDAAFHEYRQDFARAERRGSAHHVARVALRYRGVAGADLFVLRLACEFFGGYFAIAVHQYDEGLAAFVFHYQGFDDGVFGDIQFAGGDLCSAVVFVGVKVG